MEGKHFQFSNGGNPGLGLKEEKHLSLSIYSTAEKLFLQLFKI